MGGLISGNQGAGTTGVPVLGQLPVLGRLFRTDAVQEDRTELMVIGHPLRDRRPRGRLGAHPADPGAARSAYRAAAMTRSGARAWGSGTSVSARPATVHEARP